MLAAFLTNNLIEAGSSWTMAGVSQRALQTSTPTAVRARPDPADELLRRKLHWRSDESTDQRRGCHQPSSRSKCHRSAGQLPVDDGHSDSNVRIGCSLGPSFLTGDPDYAWANPTGRSLYSQRIQRPPARLGQLNSVMEETIGGQKVVSAFGRNDSAIAEFRKHNQAVCEAGIYANTYAFLLMPLTSVLGNLFVIVLVGLGGWLALQGLVSVGLIATFINYGQNFVQPLRQLSNLYNTLQAALAGAERVFQILDTASEIDSSAHSESPVAVKGLVRFGHVDFSYHAGQPILHDMNLEAEPGQMIALVGPTGAGKTTIINLLTRFYELDSGSIEIDGRNITQLAKSDLRRMLGLVLQDTYLFGATVMENIRYGRLDASDEEVMEAARTADAHTFVMQLPQGYQTVLSERASNLSQGQRQLLAIARTVLADPAILILDEATSSIDTRTELRIQTSLLRLMKGRTSFVIAHRLSTIRDADQVLVIKGGQIVERGTHQQLLDQRGLYAQMHQGAAPTP
jgi:ATP-binding cassette subfamily B multidrug efflux pump